MLTESENPATYWRVLKTRLLDEGNKTVTNCNGLKMQAADGKMRSTDGARNYWRVLKRRLKDEGSQLVTECNQLKLKSPKDGKAYKTDIATTEQLLRIIQSIPSKKTEPFKLWLTHVGAEHIEETIDPEQAIDRALETYQRRGRKRPRANTKRLKG